MPGRRRQRQVRRRVVSRHGPPLPGAALLAASAAQAGPRWSISINVPLPGVVVSEGRYVEPAPVYYAPPPPVYVAPPPRYVEREIYYAPPPRVIYEPVYRVRRCDDRRWAEGRWERERYEHRWDERRDDDGPWRRR